MKPRHPFAYRGKFCICGPTYPDPDCVCMRNCKDSIGLLNFVEYSIIGRGGTLE